MASEGEVAGFEVLNTLFGFTTITWINDLLGGPTGPNAPESMITMAVIVALYVGLITYWSVHGSRTAAAGTTGIPSRRRDLRFLVATLLMSLAAAGVLLLYVGWRLPTLLEAAMVVSIATFAWVAAALLIDPRFRATLRRGRAGGV